MIGVLVSDLEHQIISGKVFKNRNAILSSSVTIEPQENRRERL